MKDYLWLIPLLPAIGAVINLLAGRFLGKRLVSLIACGTVLGSFILSVITFSDLLNLPHDARVIRDIVYTWIQIGSTQINLAFLIDPLSAIMLLVVSGVSFVIHIYSIGYMSDDKRYSRYFGFLNLFVFFMLLLVSADNLLIMFIGWEGVGLCSYLLIGFWFEKKANAIAGMKAFIVNRIGDFGFVIGIFLLFWSVGTASGVWTINFPELQQHIHSIGPGIALAVALLLFVGAAGKSAQIPLYVWLPDAMAGPTPVSALIHAATMVTAGVYMIARMNFLYVLAPTAMMIVAIVGVTTAFYAGTIALMQNDIKKILAYSTISQLGYMFVAVGVGAFAAGIFHLMTHAFFKALLFLGAGSVMHGTGGETDIRKMGGLRKYMPITFWIFLIGTLAITGIPGLSGFFSKDEILWKSFSSPFGGHWLLWLVGVAGAGLTALYMFRLLFMTFFGKNRLASGAMGHSSGTHNAGHTTHDTSHIHESPAVMTVPLIILAVFSVIGGYVGIPHILGGSNHIEKFMEPVFAQHHPPACARDSAGRQITRNNEISECKNGICPIEQPFLLAETTPLQDTSTPNNGASHNGVVPSGTPHTTDHHGGAERNPDSHKGETGLEILLMVISVVVVLFSIFIAYILYIKKTHLPAKLAKKFSGIYKLLLNKYYIDEIYQVVFINSLLKLNNILAYKIDLGIIDWLVNAIGKVTVGISFGSGWTDKTFVDGAVNATAQGVLVSGDAVRYTQTGKLKNYLAWVVGGIIALVIAFWFFII